MSKRSGQDMLNFYNRYIMPRLMNCACGYKKVAKIRREVVPQAEGVVVEFGVGSGYNLKHYNRERVKRVIGVDPTSALTSLGEHRFDRARVEFELVEERAEASGLDSDMADTVVVTYTLCSVKSVEAVLAEARRVLKPTGKLLFLEHGLAPDERVAAIQQRWSGVMVKFAGGCHLTRDMEALISGSGFEFDWLDKRWVWRRPRTSSFQYLGAARPS